MRGIIFFILFILIVPAVHIFQNSGPAGAVVGEESEENVEIIWNKTKEGPIYGWDIRDSNEVYEQQGWADGEGNYYLTLTPQFLTPR